MGLTHIYCGDGKGKTTAALGLALRAAGTGLRVHIVQFLKGRDSGELHALKALTHVTVARWEEDFGFSFQWDQEGRERAKAQSGRLFRAAESLAKQGKIDLLILDEFFPAFSLGLLDREAARQLVLQKPRELELVLTGRDPEPDFLAVADYVSEIRCVKHPYDKGVSARSGIEF